MLDLQDRALLGRAVRDLDSLRRDLLREHMEQSFTIAETIGRIRAVLNHHGGSSALHVSKPLAGAVLIPPSSKEAHVHEPAEVSEHELALLCAADLDIASRWQPVALPVEGVGCTEEGPLSDAGPPVVLQPPAASGDIAPARIISRRLFGTARKAATEPVVDLVQYRLAERGLIV